ncbi:MAG: hypothetical protein PHU03_02255, partial [Syntrophales bacterium]|nr:hypothetical protein [Syntrophales bacterium]
SKEEFAEIIPRFKAFAVQAGLAIVSVDPRLESLDATPGYLSVDTVVRGSFFALREFLFMLARLPYFEGIEAMSIRQVGAGENEKQIDLKVLLIAT